ncbi:hypothetical protein [Flavobacterium sp. JP2137]|uniref:hypothetical protein n=1 Tax=Flavobacterium sp. JP2137 TaxID=3414510 RepID=UPI003D2FDE02
MKRSSFKSCLLLCCLFVLSGQLFAQITPVGGTAIGAQLADPSSALDVVGANTGVLIPRVANIATSIQNPANGLLVYDTDRQCLSQNIGTPANPNWVCISGNVVKFFYMPSIVLDITNTSGSYNLYELYKTQFSNPRAVSNGAPTQIPFFSAASDLYYYVTHYSETVFYDVAVTADGILTYRVQPTAQLNGDSSDFMNVVLVVK